VIARGRTTASSSTDSTPGQPRLIDRLRREIEAHGPITFARFMEVALYDPQDGYYVRRLDRPTRSGDYLTAPETHPLFGRTLARQVAECWERLGRPDPFVVREYGAGSGALAASLVDGLLGGAPEVIGSLRYQPVESAAPAVEAIRGRVTVAGLSANRLETAGGPMDGLVIANEFLDALPVHRIVVQDGRLLERFVGWEDDRFNDVDAPPSTPRLGERLASDGVRLAEGQEAEVCLAVDDWIAEVASDLRHGYLIAIDYGHPAGELYSTRRMEGTLLAYRGHRVVDDPYAAVGNQDLTAHVDLTHLEKVARDAGFSPVGRTTQAEFLAGLGMGELLDELGRDPGTTPEDYLAARAAVGRFLDPRATGGFAVAVFARGVATDAPLRGLTFRLDA
jgi:SAM-dependent MidA family methyltransferase